MSSKKVLFEAGDSISVPAQLQPTLPSGELIDYLVEICSLRPEYLRPEDARRHIALLALLKEFLAAETGSDLPSFRLGLILERWIKSYLFDDRVHPLLASYALDTAHFLVALIEGYHSYQPESWEITGILNCSGESKPDFSFLWEKQFKKRFTEKACPIDVLAYVPSGCSVISRNNIEVIPSNCSFAYKIHRCHLSESVEDSYNVHLYCKERGGPRFDVGQQFQFNGSLLVSCRGSFQQYYCPSEGEIARNLVSHPRDWEIDKEINGVGMQVPARWITHALDYHDPREIPNPIPVPEW